MFTLIKWSTLQKIVSTFKPKKFIRSTPAFYDCKLYFTIVDREILTCINCSNVFKADFVAPNKFTVVNYIGKTVFNDCKGYNCKCKRAKM